MSCLPLEKNESVKKGAGMFICVTVQLYSVKVNTIATYETRVFLVTKDDLFQGHDKNVQKHVNLLYIQTLNIIMSGHGILQVKLPKTKICYANYVGQ